MEEVDLFHTILSNLVRSSGKSEAALGDEAGLSSATIPAILKNKRQPNLVTFVRLCHLFDVTPNEFLGYSNGKTLSYRDSCDERLKVTADFMLSKVIELAKDSLRERPMRPSIRQVMRWWSEGGAELQRDTALLDYADLYDADYVARHGEPRCVELGRSSLASEALMLSDVNDLERVYAAVGEERRRKVARDQIAALERPSITVETIDVDPQTGSGRVRESYLRLLVPARHEGNKVILNFSCFFDCVDDFGIMNNFTG